MWPLQKLAKCAPPREKTQPTAELRLQPTSSVPQVAGRAFVRLGSQDLSGETAVSN